VTLNGRFWVTPEDENESTFHPKLYLFKSADAADLVVGSGNLTTGGLFTNYEASLALSLDLTAASDRGLLGLIDRTLDEWTDPTHGTVRRLDQPFLEDLLRQRYVVLEAQQPGEPDPEGRAAALAPRVRTQALFARVGVRAAPAGARRTPQRPPALPPVLAATRSLVQGFVMTLQQTDAGFGQTTRGTARRSPEIFVPLAARDFSPAFWGWQDMFSEDVARPGKWDRRAVRVRIGTQIAEVNMMTWPVKHDFRLRSEALRSAGTVGDILRLEKVEGAVDYDYYAEIIPSGSSQYNYYFALCTGRVRNSDKRWGYYL